MINSILAVRLRMTLSTVVTTLLVVTLLFVGNPGQGVAAAGDATTPEAQNPLQPTASYLIMENMGQYPGEARFLIQQGDQRVWLTEDALWLMVPDEAEAAGGSGPSGMDRRGNPVRREQRSPRVLSGTAIRFTFPGANHQARLEPFGRVSTRVSYLIGNDPSLWHRDVPVWSGVRYRDLYPGVDLVIGDGAVGAVPWRLEARPGADLHAVALRAEGADSITAETGQLKLQVKGRALDVVLPTWLQGGQANPSGSRVTAQAGDGIFALAQQGAAPAAPASGAGSDAVDAPEDLIYNVSLVGAGADAGTGIAVDYLGNAYVTGETTSSNFPATVGAYDTTYNGAAGSSDAFVAKYNAIGTLLWATYLGGTGADMGWDIAVVTDLAYVVGETSSTDFPGSPGPAGTDIFVAAFNATGSNIRYTSRLGGDNFDTGSGIAVEGLNAFVVGTTYSTNLPGTNCANSSNGNVVVAELGPLGTPLYTTCLGGSDLDTGSGIAVRDSAAYVTGESFSLNLPGGLAAVSGDILVAQVDATGAWTKTALVGGSAEDAGSDIAIDGLGNIYLAGTTSSAADFPGTSGTGAWGGGLNDGVVVKLLSDFTTIDFATYLGGSDEDYPSDIAVDTVQALYVGGATFSNNFPVTASAYDTTQNGAFDVFAVRIHSSSSALNKVTYGTYLGAARDDWGLGATTDTGGHIFVTGSKQPSLNSTDAFVAKLKVSSPPGAPVVSISVDIANAANAVLNWPPVGSAVAYQVFRSARPYFIPGNGSVALPRPNQGATSQLDAGALTPVGAYFYVVKAVSSAPAAGASSNQVGEFTFELVKGGN